MSEYYRLHIIEKNQGLEALTDFDKRTYRLYRACLRNPKHHASLPQYRKSFIDSCLVFRAYLKGKS